MADKINPASLDELIEEITLDAYGEEEQLRAFRQAFEDQIAVPCDGTVIGEAVSLIEFDYDGMSGVGSSQSAAARTAATIQSPPRMW